VHRFAEGPEPPAKPATPKIGIVLVFCEEQLDFLNEVGCTNVVFHLFSKCHTTQAAAVEMAPRIASCIKTFKTVRSTLETELAWPKHHVQYLEHIIERCVDAIVSLPLCFCCSSWPNLPPWLQDPRFANRYDVLEPWTIFCKANLEARRLNLREMVREVIDGQWAFYSFGNPKVKEDPLRSSEASL
jgi:hypothetical protein